MSGRNFRSVPPPSNLNNRSAYSRFDDVHSRADDAARASSAVRRFASRFNSEEDYFDQDDEDVGSKQQPEKKVDDLEEEVEDEEDPLDAFMADLAKSESSAAGGSKSKKTVPVSVPVKVVAKVAAASTSKVGVRHDIEEEDNEESYYRYMKENPNAGIGTLGGSDDEEDAAAAAAAGSYIEYDEDGNPLPANAKKLIDPLPMVYHSEITYPSFEKNFYAEHAEIKRLSAGEVFELRRKLGIRVSGPSPPKPVTSFAHFGFDETLMKAIRKLEYTQPTPIQTQAIPAALSGRDLIGIAKTGSGKTAAFIWPLIVHILDQPQLKAGDGPIGVILAPTRELSQQIYAEAKRFAKPYGIHVVCAYGGGSKYEQSKDLEQGADIIVATPGRMIDFVKMKATNFLRTTYLVLDEADRMFDMGFEVQVRSICNHVRPDRQTLMFSATFKKRIEKLARDVLSDPIRIVQGEIGDANTDITQTVHVFASGTTQKWDWLMEHLVELTSAGSVLIFVTKKANSQELAVNMEAQSNYKPLLLHGDMSQHDRNAVITAFKKQESPVLIATDVAARGLDIAHIRTVLNYDIALDIDTHTHRIGRTGRAGERGVAITLVTEKDKEFVGHLVRNLEGANQVVPEELMNLALQSAWFRKARFQGGKGKRPGGGGSGAVMRARPGLGAPGASSGFSFKAPAPSSSSSYSGSFVAASKPYSSSPTVQSDSSASASSSDTTNNTGGNERIAAIKAAYRAQFRSQFTAATDTAWEKTQGSGATSSSSSNSDQQGGARKKSRWG